MTAAGYVATVTRPGPVEAGIDWSALSREVSRHPADTLDEARLAADGVVTSARGDSRDIAWCDAADAALAVGARGGEIKLPNGETVSVERVEDDGEGR